MWGKNLINFMFTIKTFLSNQSNIDFNKESVKLVRHKNNAGGHDFNSLFLNNHKLFNLYQSFQARPIFDNCDYLISFVGTRNTYAKFIGVFKVLEKCDTKEKKYKNKLKAYLPEYGNMFKGCNYYYELEEINGFGEFKDRIVIDWGPGALAFVQRNDKNIFEILPKGYVKEFPGFLDFTLDFNELEHIINNPESNREWRTLLSSAAGIYLILDNRTGNQYIGSAYGENGIWGRWKQYVQTKHGGNQKLIDLLKKDAGCFKKFQFTILQTLPKTLTAREVIEFEKKIKIKLGSRAFGLNSN